MRGDRGSPRSGRGLPGSALANTLGGFLDYLRSRLGGHEARTRRHVAGRDRSVTRIERQEGHRQISLQIRLLIDREQRLAVGHGLKELAERS